MWAAVKCCEAPKPSFWKLPWKLPSCALLPKGPGCAKPKLYERLITLAWVAGESLPYLAMLVGCWPFDRLACCWPFAKLAGCSKLGKPWVAASPATSPMLRDLQRTIYIMRIIIICKGSINTVCCMQTQVSSTYSHNLGCSMLLQRPSVAAYHVITCMSSCAFAQIFVGRTCPLMYTTPPTQCYRCRLA